MERDDRERPARAPRRPAWGHRDDAAGGLQVARTAGTAQRHGRRGHHGRLPHVVVKAAVRTTCRHHCPCGDHDSDGGHDGGTPAHLSSSQLSSRRLSEGAARMTVMSHASAWPTNHHPRCRATRAGWCTVGGVARHGQGRRGSCPSGGGRHLPADQLGDVRRSARQAGQPVQRRHVAVMPRGPAAPRSGCLARRAGRRRWAAPRTAGCLRARSAPSTPPEAGRCRRRGANRHRRPAGTSPGHLRDGSPGRAVLGRWSESHSCRPATALAGVSTAHRAEPPRPTRQRRRPAPPAP